MTSRARALVNQVRRWAGGLMPGAKDRRVQTADYAAEWDADNEIALQATGPLWVVLGDSTAQAIGTSDRHHGYVYTVLAALREQRDPSWRVLNLSHTGARVRDVLADQLPKLDRVQPDLVTCAAGANDLVPTSRRRLQNELRDMAARLPNGALLANLPQGLAPRRAMVVNELIAELADEHGLVLVDLWRHTGPPWAGKFSADHFHPNDTGYKDWAVAFLEALGLDPPPSS